MVSSDFLMVRALASPAARDLAAEQLLGLPFREFQRAADKAARSAAKDQPAARFLLLYEARGRAFPMPQALNTVFDRSVLLDLIGNAKSPAEIDEALRRAGITHVILNEPELHRLINFYSPGNSGERIPPGFTKSPNQPSPFLHLYRPYAKDARFPAAREALTAWHESLIRRAQWKTSSSRGLVLCLTPLGESGAR